MSSRLIFSGLNRRELLEELEQRGIGVEPGGMSGQVVVGLITVPTGHGCASGGDPGRDARHDEKAVSP